MITYITVITPITSLRTAFGEAALGKHTLMFECLIHTLLQIECPHYLPPIESMKISKKELTNKEYEKWSTAPLPQSFCHSLEAWAMLPPCTCYKRLASLLSVKRDQHNHELGCRLSFSLLCSSIMCIRGARSSQGHPH